MSLSIQKEETFVSNIENIQKIRDIRTLESKINDENFLLTKYVFIDNEKTIVEKIDLTNKILNEIFIDKNQAVEYLNITMDVLDELIHAGVIPYYQFKDVQGSKIFFKKLELSQDFYFEVDKLHSPKEGELFYSRVGKKLFWNILNVEPFATEYRGRKRFIIKSVLLGKSYRELSEKCDYTPTGLSQIFKRYLRQANNWLENNLINEISYYRDGAQELRSQIMSLKSYIVLHDINSNKREEFLDKPIYTFQFSSRVMNGLKNQNIKTLRELMSMPLNQLQNLSYLGQKCIKEIDDFFKSNELNYFIEHPWKRSHGNTVEIENLKKKEREILSQRDSVEALRHRVQLGQKTLENEKVNFINDILENFDFLEDSLKKKLRKVFRSEVKESVHKEIEELRAKNKELSVLNNKREARIKASLRIVPTVVKKSTPIEAINIKALNLPKEIHDNLIASNINTIGEIMKAGEEGLMKIKNFSENHFNVVSSVLERDYGLIF